MVERRSRALKAPHPGGYRRFRAQSQDPQCQGDGLGGNQDATTAGGCALSPPLSPVAGRWLAWRGQGQGLGPKDVRVERGSRGASTKARSQGGALMAWAREWAKEGVKVDWQHLLPPKGFQVLPRRWVVERTFSWIDQNRRMSKDYQSL
jgi:hypothetical protein